MSVTAESIPPGTQSIETTVSIEVSADDVLRLQAPAGRSPDGKRDSAELLRSAFHRGVIETYRIASPQHTRPSIWRGLGLGAAALATIVVIVGSFAGHWTWTGFRKSGQVWDWMQLLLLPVALGTFPLWLRFSGEMSRARRKALGAAVLAFVAFVVAGYVVPLRWTGFRGHTLWNWLTLIVLPITITTATVWPKTGRRFRPVYRDTAEFLGAAWVVTLIGGYGLGWAWRGYPGTSSGTGCSCCWHRLPSPHSRSPS